MSDYTTEVFHRVYHDGHGFYYEIRPDADGLDCVEVRYSEDGKAAKVLMTVPPDAARLVANAMLKAADEIEKKDNA